MFSCSSTLQKLIMTINSAHRQTELGEFFFFFFILLTTFVGLTFTIDPSACLHLLSSSCFYSSHLVLSDILPRVLSNEQTKTKRNMR